MPRKPNPEKKKYRRRKYNIKRVRVTYKDQEIISKEENRARKSEARQKIILISRNWKLLSFPTDPSAPPTGINLDAQLFTGVLNQHLRLLNELEEWSREGNEGFMLSEKVNDMRGKHRTVNLGVWKERGHNRLHFTPATLDPSGLAIINRYKVIWDIASQLVQKNWPEEYNRLKMVDEDKRLLGVFMLAILNFEPIKKLHCDDKDMGICVIIPFSDFKGGYLDLKYCGINVKVRKGDIFIFRSNKLWHNLTKVIDGVRKSIVLVTRTDAYDLAVLE